MTEPPTRCRCTIAGLDGGGRPVVAQLALDGPERAPVGAVIPRRFADPAVRAGQASPGRAITGLAPIHSVDGGAWLLATVTRGRPRLLDPERLGVVGLLGRRREWPGASADLSPFLSLACDHPGVALDDARVLAVRTPTGEHALIRARPGEPVERWSLGGFAGRIELLAGPGVLVLVHVDPTPTRVAVVELDSLVPGGRPLADPREVALSLVWRPLRGLGPRDPLVAVLGVSAGGRRLRVLEGEGEAWRVAWVDLERGARTVVTAIPRPRRWLVAGERAWLASAGDELRVLGPEGDVLGRSASWSEPEAWTVTHDPSSHPWLWSWRRGQLERRDGLDLDRPPQRWPVTEPSLRAHALLVGPAEPSGDPRAILHADELAELLAHAPELAGAWPRWFEPS